MSLPFEPSKLIEHMIRLQKFYTDNPEKFSYKHKHSTAHQILTVVELIHDRFDYSKIVGILFIDIAKVFDTIWHSGLIYKLLKVKISTAYV